MKKIFIDDLFSCVYIRSIHNVSMMMQIKFRNTVIFVSLFLWFDDDSFTIAESHVNVRESLNMLNELII